jgi:hypothetical protein
MSVRRRFEVTAAAAAILAGLLWLMSAWFGRAEAPRIDFSYDPSAPEERGRLHDVQTAGRFNTFAALAASFAAFAQGAGLFMDLGRRPRKDVNRVQ